MNNNTVITIGRHYGTGGRELGKILSEKLGIRLYDRKIIHMAAEQLGIDDLDYKKLKKMEESVPPLSLKFMPFYVFGVEKSEPISKKMFDTESKVIKQLAKDGSCIILGRCADFVLKDVPNVYSVFICANDSYRAKRGKTVYDGKSLYELNIEDFKRGQYYEYYTGQKWGSPVNYDLVINTSDIGLEKAADIIVKYVEVLQH